MCLFILTQRIKLAWTAMLQDTCITARSFSEFIDTVDGDPVLIPTQNSMSGFSLMTLRSTTQTAILKIKRSNTMQCMIY